MTTKKMFLVNTIPYVKPEWKKILHLRPKWSKYISSSNQNRSETITLRVSYTHIDHIREYPPEKKNKNQPGTEFLPFASHVYKKSPYSCAKHRLAPRLNSGKLELSFASMLSFAHDIAQWSIILNALTWQYASYGIKVLLRLRYNLVLLTLRNIFYCTLSLTRPTVLSDSVVLLHWIQSFILRYMS